MIFNIQFQLSVSFEFSKLFISLQLCIASHAICCGCIFLKLRCRTIYANAEIIEFKRLNSNVWAWRAINGTRQKCNGWKIKCNVKLRSIENSPNSIFICSKLKWCWIELAAVRLCRRTYFNSFEIISTVSPMHIDRMFNKYALNYWNWFGIFGNFMLVHCNWFSVIP